MGVDAVTNAGILQQWQRMSVPRRRFVAQRKSSFLLQQWWKMQLGKKKLHELKEIKRKEEEERRRKEEEERLARIKKVGEEQVRKEEELKAKLAAEQDEAEREKIRALLAGEGEEEKNEEEDERSPQPNGIHYDGPKRSLGGPHQCGRQDDRRFGLETTQEVRHGCLLLNVPLPTTHRRLLQIQASQQGWRCHPQGWLEWIAQFDLFHWWRRCGQPSDRSQLEEALHQDQHSCVRGYPLHTRCYFY